MIKHSKVVLISFVASLFYNPCISCPNWYYYIVLISSNCAYITSNK
jgi:hypothetical protein